jgi:putative transcriptional regulator
MLGTQEMTARFRLKVLLEEAGLSQSELARKSGVSYPTINGLVGNKSTRVDLSTLDAISRVLGCEPGDLLEREPNRRRRHS